MKGKNCFKKISQIFLVLCVLSLVFSSVAALAAPIIIKAGHGSSENDAVHKNLQRMMGEFEKRTNGKYVTEIYPMMQLGNERDLVEGAQMGSVGLAYSTNGPLASFVPEFGVLDLPYLIKDYGHADRVFMGGIGKELADLFSEKAGVKCLGFWELGFRNLINAARSVESVEDVAGLKIRTMENKNHLALWNALGASAVPLNGSEAFTALMQGTIDGLENSMPIIYNLKYWEAAKYLSITEHLYSPAVLMVSNKLWNGMTEEEQKILLELFDESRTYNREMVRQEAEDSIGQLEAVGVKIVYPDKEKFREKVENLRQELSAPYGEMYQRIVEQ